MRRGVLARLLREIRARVPRSRWFDDCQVVDRSADDGLRSDEPGEAVSSLPYKSEPNFTGFLVTMLLVLGMVAVMVRCS